jgi:hypothetical protein
MAVEGGGGGRTIDRTAKDKKILVLMAEVGGNTRCTRESSSSVLLADLKVVTRKVKVA